MFEFSGSEANRHMQELAGNSYPGRGIVIGKSQDGESVLQVYWVMGRTENSRNRQLIEEAGTVKTIPYDISKLEDPSLIIYNAMRQFRRHHVVANGDQTDTIMEHLQQGSTFKAALDTRTYEPDGPNFTPRISAMVTTETPEVPFSISVIRREAGSDQPVRQLYTGFLDKVLAHGTGLCVHTYLQDGNPLPSFNRNPYGVPLGKDSRDTAGMYWNSLDADNRVALAVKQIGIADGSVSFSIINRLERS